MSGQPRVFKTAHADDDRGHDQAVWKVAAATSAAPSYFAPVRFMEEDAHVDGGVWANNPSMIAITEAVRRFKRPLTDIRLLSVGAAPLLVRKSGASRPRAEWAGHAGYDRKILALLQGGPALGNHFQARLLLGEESYLRCDDHSGAPIGLDDVKASKPLAALGHNTALEMWPAVQRVLEL